eukprot:m.50839 g.50839  ORF g.50839 m.50839 type:complete len:434 (+) comp6572_c0_seq2:34-1335(+)
MTSARSSADPTQAAAPLTAASSDEDLKKNNWQRLGSRSGRLTVMLALTSTFFFVEVVVGYTSNSLALVADAFHMLSDVLSLIVGLYAVRIAKRAADDRFTFGMVRAEVLGALINSVFLIALCITIIVEAAQRFFDIEEMKRPQLVFYVGLGGLLINLIGLGMFSGHAHSHGGHGHSHGGHGHSHNGDDAGHGHSHDEADAEEAQLGSVAAVPANAYDNIAHLAMDSDASSSSGKGALNMRGVYLHVLGDALGSVAVVIVALVIWQTEWSLRYYLDPFLSLLIAALLLSHSIPLAKNSAFILLQGTPSQVNVSAIRDDLREVEDVVACHELHVWSLADEKLIASLHVTCRPETNAMELGSRLKKFFHDRGIHSVTIQQEPMSSERPSPQNPGEDPSCMLPCEDECGAKQCCPVPSEGSTTLRRRQLPVQELLIE